MTSALRPADDAAPLAGITVLDFTRVLAGPYCTRLLADLGARVIKIERPGEGDETRHGYVQVEEGRDDQSTYFLRINVGKLSVALDLGKPEARAVVLDLARKSDVAVENFLPGVVKRLGCDYASLTAVRPDLVYCSISGFGQTGPWRDQPAFAHIVQAVSGHMHLEQADDPTPQVQYLQAADVLSGTHAFGAILAALLRRGRTGQGAYLDVSMLECMIAAEDITYGAVLNGGGEYRGPRPGMGIHAVGGRHIAWQIVGAPQLWSRLVTVMGRPELEHDARFATRQARREHWPALRDLVGEWLAGFKSADDALATLSAARVPCTAVLSPTDVVGHPHLAERGAFPSVPHAARGAIRVTATPFQVDGRPVAPRGAAPHQVGEHTAAVLAEVLGYTSDRIAQLEQCGAIETG